MSNAFPLAVKQHIVKKNAWKCGWSQHDERTLQIFADSLVLNVYKVQFDVNDLDLHVMFFTALLVAVIKGCFTYIIGTGVAPVGCGSACGPAGSWSEWSTWSTCTFTYGGFSQARYRTCSAAVCVGGSFSEARPCVSDIKLAEWQQWSPWSDCSVSCGDGTRSRHRICSSVCANCQCFGAVVEIQSCNNQPCCQFGPWSAWSECSVTCGTGGISHRSRQCSCMEGCVGPTTEQKVCNANQPCMQEYTQKPQTPQTPCICYLPYPTCIVCTTYQVYGYGKRKRRALRLS